MPAISSGLPCRLRTRMRNTTFSPRLNWLVSTQIGPVAPSGVLPRTISPSTNSFCISCACADAQLATAANETAATILVGDIEKPPCTCASLRLLEIAQVRRRLVLLRRHQLPIGAQIVVLRADPHVRVELRAHVRLPDRARIGIAERRLQLDIGPGQRVVDHGHLVVELVGIGLIEIDALLDDSLA